MRVTNGMIQQNSLNALYKNMSKLDTLFNQMNTLKKISRPSDDPIVAGRSLKLRLNVMEAEQHSSNVDEASAWMNITESALDNTIEVLKSISEKCTYAANGTHTTDDRQKIVDEIAQLYEQLKQEANVTYAGRYVFSGYKTNEPVFLSNDPVMHEDVTLAHDLSVMGETTLKAGTVLATGTTFKEDVTINGVAYQAGDTLTAAVTIGTDVTLKEGIELAAGSMLKEDTALPKGTLNPKVLGKIATQDIEYEIGVNNTMAINIKDMPDMMYKLVDNIEDMLTVLDDEQMSDEALNDFFTDMIGEMESRLSEVSRMQSEVGSKQNRLEYTQGRLEEDQVNFTELLSNTENVDLEEIYVDFNTQYAVYQSALQATAKVVMNSLASFLS